MADEIFMKDEFTVWFPNSVDIIKGNGEGVDSRRIGGYASTESLDRQGEVVLQKGLDFTEFVQHGYYNDNHRQDTAAVVGVPELARYDVGKGWWTEGYLIKGVQKAEEIWKLALALAGTNRKLGFSIEGKVLERREGNKIAKAKVRHVAVTNSPVNTECVWGVLSKSFCLHAGEPTCVGTCCDFGKALSTGHSVATGGAGVSNVGGGVLRGESLEGKSHLFKCPSCSRVFGSARQLDGHMALKHKSISKAVMEAGVIRRPAQDLAPEQAEALLRRLHPDWPEGAVARIVRLVQRGGIQ